MKWFKIIFVFTFALLSMSSFGQKERKYIRQGNKEFDNSNYDNSEISYRKAADVEEEKSHKTAFNVGDALYKQEKYEDAINQFNDLSELEVGKEDKAKIYHNLGNSYMQSEKYKESIEAYKNALRNNPNDMDTKYNLVYAQKKLEEQQQQDQNQDQNQDKDKNQDQEQNQDQNKDQENNKDKSDQEQNQDKQEQQEQQQQEQKTQILKEDAERLLKALANDEKDTQQKVKEQKAAAAKVKTEKEW